MGKFKDKKFVTDAFVSREYRCAIILEEHLAEINNNASTRFAIKTLQKFNALFKDVKNVKHREYFAKILIRQFENKINNSEQIPEFVRTLLINIIKTKYKVEILNNGKL